MVHPLRDYQEECIELWEQCPEDIFLVDIFCGLGKSRIMQEMLLLSTGHRVVVMSSLSLVNQFCKGELTEIKRKKQTMPYMVFCTLGDTDEVESATTSVEAARQFLRKNKNGIIAVTYHSLEKLMEAFDETAVQHLFCDESHNVNCASNRWIAESDKFEKIVYLSATPGEIENAVEDSFRYSYSDALDHCDEDGKEAPFSQDVRVHVGSITGTNNDDSVLALLVKTALETTNMRVLTFSNTVNGESATSVNHFKDQCDKDAERLVQSHPLGHRVNKVTVMKMDGFTPQADRDRMLKTLDETPDDELCILCSCQTISEGVNTRRCNMVAFIDPVRCWQLIVQRMGRGVRLQEGRPPATILIPCFVDMAEVQTLSSPEERDAYVRTHYAAGNPMFDFLAAIREGCPDLLAQLVDMYKGPQGDRLSHYKQLLGDSPRRLTLDEAVERATGIKTTDVATAARTSSRSIDVHRREAPVEQCEGAAAIEASIVEMEPDRYVVARGAVPEAPRKNRLVFDSVSPFLQSIRFDDAMGTAVVEYELRPEYHEQRIAQLHEFYAKYGEAPKQHKFRENESILSKYVSHRRQDKKKGKNVELCEKITKEFTWWTWVPFAENHEVRLRELYEFYAEHGDPPKQNGIRKNEKVLVKWISHRVQDKKKGINLDIYDRIKKEWIWTLSAKQEQRIAELHAFFKKYGKPKYKGGRENEIILFEWISTRRKDKKKGKNLELCARCQNEFSWWSWDPLGDELETTIQALHAFYAKYGIPKKYGVRENEKSLAVWIGKIRQAKKKGENAEFCARCDHEFPWLSWDPFADGREKTIQDLHTFYAKYGKPNTRGVRENEHSLGLWIGRIRRDKKKGKKLELCARIESEFPWIFEGLSDSISENNSIGIPEELEETSGSENSTVETPREKRPRDEKEDEPQYRLKWTKICKRGYTEPNEVDKDQINGLFSASLPSAEGVVLFLDYTNFKTANACVSVGVPPCDMVIPQNDEAAFALMSRDPVFGPSVVLGDFNDVLRSFQGRRVPIRGIYADFTGPLRCGLDLVDVCKGLQLVPGAVVGVTITLRNPEGNDSFTNSAIETLSSAMTEELGLVSVRTDEGDRVPPIAYGNGAPMVTILKRLR